MSETYFAITPELAEGFKRFADTVSSFLDDYQGILPEIPAEDEEMKHIWQQSLHEELRQDCEKIQSLVNHEDFGTETLFLNHEEVDAILRACAAVRLRIHRTHLQKIPDKQLETGEIDEDTLDENTRRSWSVYTFLASLQEILIAQLEE